MNKPVAAVKTKKKAKRVVTDGALYLEDNERIEIVPSTRQVARNTASGAG